MSSSTPDPKAGLPPPRTNVDISRAIQDALAADTVSYKLSDVDFAARFPGLVAGRQGELDDALKQLTGPMDPVIQQQFQERALGGALGAFGGGDPLSGQGLQKGSMGYNNAAASFANQTLQKQDVDRTYFDQLLAENPQGALGLSGTDIANIAMFNTGAQNLNNQQQVQAELARIYAQGQQGVATGQMISGIGGIISGVGSAYGSYSGGGYGQTAPGAG